MWEPVPDCCRPEDLASAIEALKFVDVVSPNHQELSALFGGTEQSDLDMERQCTELLSRGFGERQGAVVVRCGEQGCKVATPGRMVRIPAYHQAPGVGLEATDTSHTKVVDPTGAGNAYLGGFCVGLLDYATSSKKYEEAAIYGTIAASFAIEQIGLPKLSCDSDGKELWNGEEAVHRLASLRRSISLGL